MLLPRITRAGEVCKTKGRVRLSSTLVVRSDLAKMVMVMGADMKPYSTSLRLNTAAVPMEQAVEATADGLEKRKRMVKSQKIFCLHRILSPSSRDNPRVFFVSYIKTTSYQV